MARVAGVSQATVSHVLNGKDERVSQSVRERVLNAARQLNYVPNPVARSLKTRRNHLIAVLVPDVRSSFYMKAIAGIESVLDRHDYHLLVANARSSSQHAKHQIHRLAAGHVDGLIVIQPSWRTDPPLQAILESAEIPFVYVNAYLEDWGLATSVHEDSCGGVYSAVKHLIEVHGHRRIAFLGGSIRTDPPTYHCEQMLEGYRQAMADGGLTVSDELIHIEAASIGFEDGLEMVHSLLHTTDDFTAIVTINDAMAAAAIQALRARGRRVPEDVAVIGGADLPHIAEVIQPRMTTVDYNLEGIGRAAATALLEQIDGEPAGAHSKVVVPSRLIIRESCGCNSTPITRASAAPEASL